MKLVIFQQFDWLSGIFINVYRVTLWIVRLYLGRLFDRVYLIKLVSNFCPCVRMCVRLFVDE